MLVHHRVTPSIKYFAGTDLLVFTLDGGRSLEFRVYYYFALFTNNYYYIKVHNKENKNISKINYRSISEKKMCAVTKVA